MGVMSQLTALMSVGAVQQSEKKVHENNNGVQFYVQQVDL